MSDVSIDCGEYDHLHEPFIDGFFIGGWDCAMTGGEPITQLMMMSLIFGGVGLSLFITTGSLVIPAIMMILFGGVVFALLPATIVNLALVVTLLLLGGLGLLVAFRAGR